MCILILSVSQSHGDLQFSVVSLTESRILDDNDGSEFDVPFSEGFTDFDVLLYAMWLLKPKKPSYLRVESSESASDLEYDKDRNLQQRNVSLWTHVVTVGLIGVLCLIVGFAFGEFIQDNGLLAKLRATSTKSSKCSNPVTRKEWRSLSAAEKQDYITAVQCLTTKQSKLSKEEGDTLYNDFPYLHTTIGGYSHGAAAFLSWHRLFLHNYENELKTTCGYKGSLTYWDWSLDWESLQNAPVFSNTTGFGGNGDLGGPESVFNGHCVADGPFAWLQLPFYDGDDHVHCLSRGFKFDQKILHGDIPGKGVRPSAVERFLSLPDFESFFLALENGPHNVIPTGIQGDFMGFTAPNDPIFFLHHSQLDRLWWMWQHRNPAVRLSEYSGKPGNDHHHPSNDVASLSDVLSMGGFAVDMQVSDIINTQSDFLCYKY